MIGSYIHAYLPRALAVVFAGAVLLSLVATVRAEGEGIGVVSSSLTSEFPEGFRIKVQATGGDEIASIAVRLRIGQRTSGVYNYLDIKRGEVVDGELFWRTNTAGTYIPPGTIITYIFEIEDQEGNLIATEPQEFIYFDARFDWDEVTEGPVAVAYHGPVKKRAETILQTILQTIHKMGPLLGADIDGPIRVTMYNNIKEMLVALPPRSATVGRELVTEGQAFNDVGTLLVLGGGRQATGTASHEVTHILTHRAGDSIFRTVPSWLSEGLSEYGNVAPGFSYDIALEFAVETDRLLPVVYMNTLLGNPEDAIIFYGEARSIVRYMIETLGQEKMKELMAAMKAGTNLDLALLQAYGLSRQQLDAQWRSAIGAPEYTPPESGRAAPTPLPLPTVELYTLTPQPNSSEIGNQGSTPTPEPVPTPTAVAVALASGDAATPTPESPAAQESQHEPVPGGECSGPVQGGTRTMDASLIALFAAVALFGLRRRLRR